MLPARKPVLVGLSIRSGYKTTLTISLKSETILESAISLFFLFRFGKQAEDFQGSFVGGILFTMAFAGTVAAGAAGDIAGHEQLPAVGM